MEKAWLYLSIDTLKQNLKSNYAMILESRFALFFIFFSIWLLFTPYTGIWHDARVYLLTAYHALRPEVFSNDLWFKFGSQADASLFDELYAAIIKLVGVSTAAMLITFVGGGLYAISIIKMAMFENRKSAILVALALIVIPFSYNYDNSEIFILNENFATPRLYVISLTIISICYWLSNKKLLALGFFIISLILHPIMAIWGLLAIITYNLNDKALFTLTVIGLAGLGFAMSLSLPFFSMIEPLWYELVANTSAIVFVKQPENLRIDSNLWCIAVLLMAAKLANHKIQRLFLAVAFVCSWAWLISVIVNFYLPAELLTQLQLWRVLWLATYFAPFAFLILWQSATPERSKNWYRLGLIFCFSAAGNGGGMLLFLAWLFFSTRIFQQDKLYKLLEENFSTTLKTLIFYIVLALSLLLIYFNISSYLSINTLNMVSRENDGLTSLLLFKITVFILAILMLILRKGYLFVYSISILLFSIALFSWDQRSAGEVALEDNYYYRSENIITEMIPEDHSIYWPGRHTEIWFVFNRPAYAISAQGIGIIFSKKHAYLLYERLSLIKKNVPHNTSANTDSIYNLHNPIYHPTNLTEDAITRLCEDKDLGVIAYNSKFGNLPNKKISYNDNDYYLYFCPEIREHRNIGATET